MNENVRAAAGRPSFVGPGGSERREVLMGEGDDRLRTLVRGLGAARVFVVSRDAVIGLLDSSTGLLSAPPVTCLDIRTAAREAHDAGRSLCVDVSACGPLGCPAVRLGADVAVSLLDDIAVVGVARGVDAELVASLAVEPSDDVEMACSRARARLDEWHRSSDAARVVAAYLSCHPRVEKVFYPGLVASTDHRVAASTLVSGFGPFVDYVDVSGDGCWQRVDANGQDGIALVEQLERQLVRQ